MIVLQTRQTDKVELENICVTAEKNGKSTVYKKINEKKINQRVPRKRAINKKLIGDFQKKKLKTYFSDNLVNSTEGVQTNDNTLYIK